MTGELFRLLRVALGLTVNPARIVHSAADRAKHLMVFAACGIGAGVVLLPALGCAAAGLWIIVQHQLGPVWAAFITAGAFALLALIILLIGFACLRAPRRGQQRHRHDQAEHGPGLLDQAGAILPAVLGFLAARREEAKTRGHAAVSDARVRGRGLFARHKGAFVLGALAVGLLLGQDLLRPRRRPRD